MSKKYKFRGIPSGDGDGFCWDVSKEEFIKIKNEEPEEFDESFFNKGLYRIYPNDFFEKKKIVTTTIIIED